jgi:hypothetical protein
LAQAKLQRMQGDAALAITTLEVGLAPDRPHQFVQADALVRCVRACLVYRAERARSLCSS